MRYSGNFEFYCTFVEKLTDNIPITIPFNLTPAKIKALVSHNSLRFIHAGNWWNFKNPAKRSKESILEKRPCPQPRLRICPLSGTSFLIS